MIIDRLISELGDLMFLRRTRTDPELAEDDSFGAAVSSITIAGSVTHVAFIYRRDHTSPDQDAPSSLRLVHAIPEFGVVDEDAADGLARLASTDDNSSDHYLCEVYEVVAKPELKLAALNWARAQVGARYNRNFEHPAQDAATGRRAFYCSELVVEAFAQLGLGDLCPGPHQLKFSNHQGHISNYWIRYFGSAKAVPEGQPGTHPGTLIRSTHLRLLLKLDLECFLLKLKQQPAQCASIGHSKRSVLYKMPFRLPTTIDSALHFVTGAAISSQFVKPNTPLIVNKEFDVIEPRSGKLITQCVCARSPLIDLAVEEARREQAKWALIGAQQRGLVLRKAANIIRHYADFLAHLETVDCGKTITESKWDINCCAETFEFFAGTAHNLAGEHFPLSEGRYAYTVNIPWGVVAAIGVWNYPMQTASWKIAPALMCGNAVIYKPSPLAPVTSAYLAQILQAAGLPDGVLSVVQGDAETGKLLCEHKGVDKVSFTGSSVTGAKILESCSLPGSLKVATMELGGKSACIIFGDADIEMAVTGAMMANFYCQGEVCSNASKILVHRSIYEEFKQRIVVATTQVAVGDPLLPGTAMGAMISHEHMVNVRNFITEACGEGAKLLCGGKPLKIKGLEGGFYLSPAVMSGITDSMRIYKEEVFGPVMLLIPFESDEEAIKMANDSPYGLAAGIFTNDMHLAYSTVSLLQAGNVYVNTFNDTNPMIPFGGIKQSGFGRENGVAALRTFSQIKSIFVNASKKLDGSLS